MADREDGQKRRDFRTETSYPIWYRRFSEESAGGDWVRAVSRDLSGGGASFDLPDMASTPHKTGDLLEVQVVVPPSPVFAIAKIVRLFQDERGTWYAGASFASIDPRDKDRIVRTVLSEGVGRP